MNFSDMSPEMQAQIQGMTPEEILEMAKKEGYELTQDETNAVLSNMWSRDITVQCPKCFRTDLPLAKHMRCPKCGYEWDVPGIEPVE